MWKFDQPDRVVIVQREFRGTFDYREDPERSKSRSQCKTTMFSDVLKEFFYQQRITIVPTHNISL